MNVSDPRNRDLTTGEAAKLSSLTQQTIIRCFDNGSLKGYRVPGSRFRRIPRKHLYRFLKDNGIPTDKLERNTEVLVIDHDNTRVEALKGVIPDESPMGIISELSAFGGAYSLCEIVPAIVVLNTTLPDIQGEDAVRSIRQRPNFDFVKILCLVDDPGSRQDGLIAAGADAVLSLFTPVDRLMTQICTTLATESKA